ncbi:MAG: alpha-amylase family glycosyl hydrolase, partial [Elusimicrobiota bacterium]
MRKSGRPRVLPLVISLLTLVPNGVVTSAAAQTFSASHAPVPASAGAGVAGAATSAKAAPAPLALTALTIAPLSFSGPSFSPALAFASLPKAAARPSAATPLSAETPVKAPTTALAVAGRDSDSAISPAAGLKEASGVSRHNPSSLPSSEEAAPGAVFDGNKQRAGSIKEPREKESSGTRHAARPAESALRAPLRGQRLQDLRHLLGDGTETASGVIGRFRFLSPDGKTWTPALSAGLEGFYYSKRSHEATHGAANTLGQLADYLKYLDELLSPVTRTNDLRRELRAIKTSPLQPEEKNRVLNEFLLKTVIALRSELMSLDKAQWGRSAGIYMILSRAYNRIKAGPDGKPRNFFDSIDAEELARIRRETNSNTVWVLDMFDIGEINRWGSAGGSPYAIKGYTVKEELGGADAFKRFVRRAHEQGMKVMVDYIPNHTSLDSAMLAENPEAFLHIVPPQPGPAEPIEAYKKRVQDAAPRFHLRQVANYPEGNRRVPKWILVQHPYQGGGFSFTWIDMAQVDYTHPAARAYRLREARRIFEDYGVDAIRRDMSYFVLNKRFFTHWLGVLEWERDQARGWAREELGRLIEGFKARQQALGGREYLEEMMATIRDVNPAAFHIDEAYEEFDALSRSGSHARYNKVGLYDAIVSRNADWIRGALGELAFRSWQRGGAGLVNFVGTHDGGEGNPIDKLGAQFR